MPEGLEHHLWQPERTTGALPASGQIVWRHRRAVRIAEYEGVGFQLAETQLRAQLKLLPAVLTQYAYRMGWQ
jgi:hypothetical protein